MALRGLICIVTKSPILPPFYSSQAFITFAQNAKTWNSVQLFFCIFPYIVLLIIIIWFSFVCHFYFKKVIRHVYSDWKDFFLVFLDFQFLWYFIFYYHKKCDVLKDNEIVGGGGLQPPPLQIWVLWITFPRFKFLQARFTLILKFAFIRINDKFFQILPILFS